MAERRFVLLPAAFVPHDLVRNDRPPIGRCFQTNDDLVHRTRRDDKTLDRLALARWIALSETGRTGPGLDGIRTKHAHTGRDLTEVERLHLDGLSSLVVQIDLPPPVRSVENNRNCNGIASLGWARERPTA